MKQIFTSLLVFLAGIPAVLGCPNYIRGYDVKDYYTYRVVDDDTYTQSLTSQNLQLWYQIAGKGYPLDGTYSDIYSVVYKWPLSKLQSMTEHLSGTFDTGNCFMNAILQSNDKEVLDFLLTAKECEEARFEQDTKWYYFYEDDDVCRRLRTVVERAEAYKGSRLKDRYILQEIRAYVGLQKPDSILAVWNRSKTILNEGVVRDLAIDYIAGAYENLGNRDMALNTYLEYGDATQAVRYAETDPEKQFQWVYQRNPDARYLLEWMQQKISSFEDDDYSYLKSDNSRYRPLYDLVVPIVQQKRSKNMAAWYYTAAYLADKLDKNAEAMRYISLALNTSKNGSLGNSIRVLRDILKVKNSTRYNQQLEDFLFTELNWLDQVFHQNLTPSIRTKYEESGITYQQCNFSLYYWNCMMRKLLTGYVVPLCIQSNRTVEALMYLNISDYHAVNAIDTVRYYVFINDQRQQLRCSLSEYRENAQYNELDFSTDFFVNLDTLGVKHVIELNRRLTSPTKPIEKYTIEHGYFNPELMNEVIGTHLVAEMKFNEALPYLKSVSHPFQHTLNTFSYFDWNPFSETAYAKPIDDYKISIAHRMTCLEELIAKATDPNDKAELMLQYAKGLMGCASYRGWAIISYFYGTCYPSSYDSAYRLKQRKALEQRARKMRTEAFSLFTDRERAAQAYYDWKMFKTVATRYSETEIAQKVKGHCDKLIDYIVTPDKMERR